MSDDPQLANSIPQSSEESSPTAGNPPLTPLRCVIGSVLAGVLSFGMYWMTSAIAASFAAHKIQSTSLAVQRISSAVRTLVIGFTTLGTAVFGFAAIGLLALALQLIIQRLKPSTSSSS